MNAMTEQVQNDFLRAARRSSLPAAKARSGAPATMEGDPPTVVGALAQNQQRTVANMVLDDFLVELDANQDGTRSFRFRAYRRAAVRSPVA